jgi:hypothetical protein
LVYEPDGSDAHLVFELRPGAYNGETLIEFLACINSNPAAGCCCCGMACGPSQPVHDRLDQ